MFRLRPRQVRRRVRLFSSPATGAATLLAAALLFLNNAMGATVSWTDGNSNWDIGTNWSNGTGPGTLDDALIGNGGTANITTGTRTVTNLLLGKVNPGGGDGTLNISAGSLTVSNNVTISSGSNMSGTVTITGGNLSVGGIILDGGNGTGTLTLNGGTLDLTNGSIVADNFNFQSGTLSNVSQFSTTTTSPAVLTKTTAGTAILSGTNTYTGGTTIAAAGGTLLVNGTTSATGTMTVNSAGTLGGTGTVGGAVNVNAGGIINPGPKGTDGTSASVGTLTTGALTLASTATFHEDAFGTNAATAWDKLMVNGTANLGSSTLQVIIASGLTFIPGTIYTLIDATALSGTFNGIADDQLVTFSGYTFMANYDVAIGNFELVAAVPEPSTWLAAALALGAIGLSQRKRLRGMLKTM